MAQTVEALRCKLESAASIPDGVIGICHNPSGRTMALGSTQPATEFQEYFMLQADNLANLCADCLGI